MNIECKKHWPKKADGTEIKVGDKIIVWEKGNDGEKQTVTIVEIGRSYKVTFAPGFDGDAEDHWYYSKPEWELGYTFELAEGAQSEEYKKGYEKGYADALKQAIELLENDVRSI